MRVQSNLSLSLPFPPPTHAEEESVRNDSRKTPKAPSEITTSDNALPITVTSQHSETRRKTAKPVGPDARACNLDLAFASPEDEAGACGIVTLAALMEKIEGTTSLRSTDRTDLVIRHLSTMRTTVKRLAKMFNRSLDQILIEELVDIEQTFKKFLIERGSDPSSAQRYVGEINKLLAHAEQFGWSSARLAVRESWRPIQKALRGANAGPLTIVRWAIAQGIPASRFDETGMNAWREEMKRKNRSPLTLQNAEAQFRTRVRKAKNEHLIPNLNLTLRLTRYRRDGSALNPHIEADIEAKIKWKVTEVVKNRAAKFRMREVTAGDLRQILRQVCDYAEVELGKKDIGSIATRSCMTFSAMPSGYDK